MLWICVRNICDGHSKNDMKKMRFECRIHLIPSQWISLFQEAGCAHAQVLKKPDFLDILNYDDVEYRLYSVCINTPHNISKQTIIPEVRCHLCTSPLLLVHAKCMFTINHMSNKRVQFQTLCINLKCSMEIMKKILFISRNRCKKVHQQRKIEEIVGMGNYLDWGALAKICFFYFAYAFKCTAPQGPYVKYAQTRQ